MDNKQFPEQELPEELAAPVPHESQAELTPVEDLTPTEEPAAREIPPEEALPPEVPLSQEPAVPEVPAEPASPAVEHPESTISAEEPVRESIPEPAPEAPAEEIPEPVQEVSPEESPETVPEIRPEPVPEVTPEESPGTVPEIRPELVPEAASEIPPEAASMEVPEVMFVEDDLDLSFLKEFASMPEPEPSPEEINDQEYRDNGKEFDAMYNAPAPEKEPFPIHPPRKGRPKRKKGEGMLGIPNLLVTVVWLALILAIGVTLGRMVWVCAADVLAFGREDKAVTITIYEADTMDDIVDKLYSNGLIRYKSLFNLYADISDAEEDIQPGIYDLNTRYDYHALVNFMSPRSSREVVEGVLIPEGYTCRQIFALLEENKVCTAQDIAAYAANGDLGDYWFLEGVERGSENCLEGFLFPDTYDFYKNSTPREVLTKLLDNFENKFDEKMQEKLVELNSELTGDYTVREIVIVASLIEKESASSGESPNIAGVIYNRLFNWDYPAYLNIDAAIVYAQGGDAEHIDTKLDSPYNTYTNLGLTPGPIANPGLSSLKAALNPESHNYYYYVLNPSTGMHQFSTTESEHQAWVAEFYN